MKAICVNESRKLELRDIPSPGTPPSGYINVSIAYSSINHGDKTFLKVPASVLASMSSGTRFSDIWGASAAGTVTQVGPDVPASYLNRKVAIYRGLKSNEAVLGLWCETAQVPFQTCLLLPDHVDLKDYSGSLVNVGTAYAFLDTAKAEGHAGVLVTAGSSATGKALAALAKLRGVPVLMIVRSEQAKLDLVKIGLEKENVLCSGDEGFLAELEKRAQELGTTAVFDGVGGSLIGKILTILPRGSTIYFYGFLSGPEKVEFPSAAFMFKSLSMKRFSNFNTVTIQEKLGDMLNALEGCIEDQVFRTELGEEFTPEEIEKAMEYEGGKKKAVLVFKK
ncbi:putative Zn-dependent oxidoreductase [Stipitochalara longipes BDJ]|nr:putative Zn-dependent oxidoreductase [Stipitochalara longipes BDJ]